MKVIWTPQAEQDRSEIFDFIAEDCCLATGDEAIPPTRIEHPQPLHGLGERQRRMETFYKA